MFRRLSQRNMPWNFRVFAALVIAIAAGVYFFFDSGKRELYVIIPGTLLILLSGVCIGIMWRKRREMFYKAKYLASKEAEEAIAGSEQNLAVTLQSIGDAVIATDAGSCITRINPVAEKLTGWSAAEAIGRPLPEVFQIIDEETRHTVDPPAGTVLDSGQIAGLANHSILIARDGTERPVADSCSPIRSNEGETLGVVLVFRDQTEERRAEHALKEIEARYRSLFEDNPHPMWIYDLETLTFQAVNDAAVADYGYSEQEFLSMTLYDIHPRDLWPQLTRAIHSIQGTYRKSGPWELRKKDGSVIVVKMTTHDLLFNGRPGRLVLGNDVTARKNAEEALQRSEEKLRAFIESDIIGTLFADIYGKIIDANDRFLSIVGHTREELRAGLLSWIDLTPPEFLSRDESGIDEAKKRGTCTPYEKQYIRNDGTRVWVLVGYVLLGERREEAMAFILDITEHKRALEALQENQRVLSTLMGNLPGMAYRCVNNRDWTMEFVSGGCLELTGYKPEDLTNNRTIAYGELIHPGDRDAVWNEVQTATRENRQYELSYRITSADSKVKWVWEKGSGVYSPENKLIALEGFISDVTEHKNLENQLRHAQKMEAIGLLSGGIAHDFNNIINVIMGFASLLEMEIDRESPMFSHLKQIFTASDRAANLTKSLLAFSRKQAMELRPVNLNDILHRMQKLFKVLIREDIELKIRSSTDELRVMADAGQLEQVLVNLTTNAVDAMPLGGMLDISVMEINLDQEYKNVHGYGIPGRYALLTFSDTGHGMDEATRQKIFEPFFTTKETGKGTGLGLSIIYGITKQHNGYINCYSEPGKGTTFKIYLPIIDKSTGLTETTTTFFAPQSGVEMILLAEDDTQLRDLTKNVLEGYGYTVIAAVDGEDALAKFAEHGENIHLTVLDVIMPKKNGKEVFEEIRKIRRDSKVLFTSGYPEEVFNKDEIVSKGMDFIAKPVIPMDLLKKIRQVLDRQS